MSEMLFILFLIVHLPKVWRRYYEPPMKIRITAEMLERIS